MLVCGMLIQGFLTARENFGWIALLVVGIVILSLGYRWAAYGLQEEQERAKTKRLISDQPRGLNDAG